MSRYPPRYHVQLNNNSLQFNSLEIKLERVSLKMFDQKLSSGIIYSHVQVPRIIELWHFSFLIGSQRESDRKDEKIVRCMTQMHLGKVTDETLSNVRCCRLSWESFSQIMEAPHPKIHPAISTLAQADQGHGGSVICPPSRRHLRVAPSSRPVTRRCPLHQIDEEAAV